MIIKIISYNIHKGFSTTGVNFTLHQIRETLRATHPDILFLQEVVGENIHHQKKISNWPTESQFEFIADEFWPHFSYGKNAIYDGRNHGNAILTKFPIALSENINISVNKMEQRGLLHVAVNIPDLKKDLHLFNVHLNLLERDRLQQVRLIESRFKSFVPAEAGFILAGDFNDWTQKLHSHTVDYLGVIEGHHTIHQALGKSFPSHFPFLSLDRVYIKHLRVVRAEVLKGPLWAQLSDHLPLQLEIEID